MKQNSINCKLLKTANGEQKPQEQQKLNNVCLCVLGGDSLSTGVKGVILICLQKKPETSKV